VQIRRGDEAAECTMASGSWVSAHGRRARKLADWGCWRALCPPGDKAAVVGSADHDGQRGSRQRCVRCCGSCHESN
jgi:hypothetical protein